MGQVKGCHLVGSVCLPDGEEVFRRCTSGMPNRLKRIPDGETGIRQQFTVFQANFFSAVPQMMTEFINNSMIQSREYTPQQVTNGIEKLRQAAPSTGYDTAAIESYALFKTLRDDGVIPKGTRFQVCLPAVANVILPFVQKAFMAAAEPVYEEALFKAMRRIQDEIPHEDLAIQIDLAADTALWENIEMYRPWFFDDDKDLDKRKQYMVDYIVRMIAQVDQDVEVGIHNCYGKPSHPSFQSTTPCSMRCRRHGTPPLEGARIPRQRNRTRPRHFRKVPTSDKLLPPTSSKECYGQTGPVLRTAEAAFSKVQGAWYGALSGCCD